MTINLGLIGAGRMGQTFAYPLAYSIPGAKLVAIADTIGALAAEVAKKYGVESNYADYHELLARRDIDAVVIATPTGTHSQVIQDAATAGKQIFSEKPLALTLAECDAAIAAVKKAGVKFQIGFMRHFDPAFIAAKQKIDEGLIGTPVMIKSVGRDPKRTSLEFARREAGGGMILDMGIHDFDAARWLMGSEVARVSSEGECLVYPELKEVGDIDNAVVNFKFSNGAVGNVDLSRNAVYGYDVRTEIIGSKGSLFIGKLQQTPLLVMTPNSVAHDTIPYFMERFADAYATEIRDFVDCIVHDRTPQVSGADGRAATAIGIAATRSLDEKRPVNLSEIA